MEWFTPIVAFIGLGLLLYGFWKNSRGVLVAAGLLLFIAGAAPSFLRGFEDGYRATASAADATPTTP